MRGFKRKKEKIGTVGPYFCVFRLRVLTSTIPLIMNSQKNRTLFVRKRVFA